MAIASIWEGSPPCSPSALAKAPRASALRPSTMRSKLEFSAPKHIGHIAVSTPGAGLINGNLPHGAPVLLCMCWFNVVHQHPPQTGIVLIEQTSHGIDGHLSA